MILSRNTPAVDFREKVVFDVKFEQNINNKVTNKQGDEDTP